MRNNSTHQMQTYHSNKGGDKREMGTQLIANNDDTKYETGFELVDGH